MNGLSIQTSEEKVATYINRRWSRMKSDQTKFDLVAEVEKNVGKKMTDRALFLIAEKSANPESGFLAAAMFDQEHPAVC